MTAVRDVLYLPVSHYQRQYSTLLYSEKIDSRAEITFLLDIDGSNLSTGNCE